MYRSRPTPTWSTHHNRNPHIFLSHWPQPESDTFIIYFISTSHQQNFMQGHRDGLVGYDAALTRLRSGIHIYYIFQLHPSSAELHAGMV